MTIYGCWWNLLNVGARRWFKTWMLVAKMAKTVTNILKLSPTHFISNIRHQHRFKPLTISCFKLYESGSFSQFGILMRYEVYLDWIPRIFRDFECMEISFFDSNQLIELVEIFKTDPIFFEYSWIFSNKIVFETVFYMAFLAAWCGIDVLYMNRFRSGFCI